MLKIQKLPQKRVKKKMDELVFFLHGARPREPRCVHRDVFDEENGQGGMFEFLELVN